MESAELFREHIPSKSLGTITALQHDLLLQGIPNARYFHVNPTGRLTVKYSTYMLDQDLPYNPVARGITALIAYIEEESIDLCVQILVYQYALVAVVTVPATINPLGLPRYRIITQTMLGHRRSGFAHTHQELLNVYRNLRKCQVYFPHTSLTSG